jgi:NAD(P)-dependent dehydrogenase (short-subunit alcohol dehydrogenase family)
VPSSERVAIVTGAARGIGAAIAARLIESGHHVLGGDVDWDDPVIEESESFARCDLDVRDFESVDAAVAAASELGRVRSLVNCAGVLRATSVVSLDDRDVATMWDVNVAGSARMCVAAVGSCPQLEAIVNIGSISARMPSLPGIALYGATKAGLDAYTRSLACELGPSGIRVNCLAPGFIDVPMSAGMQTVSGGRQGAVQQVPLGRMGAPAEIAEVTEFLLSSRASYVHGAVVVVDGGASAR